MAKFNKRQSINNDISASDFLGKSNLPAKSSDGLDNITVGLSIEEIQDSTKNLVMFKDITAGQLMGVTENDTKRAILLSHLHQWKEQAGWIAGRLLFEIQKKIEHDYNTWTAKGEKEELKPEYITFKKWIEVFSPTLGFGVSMANQYIWLYRNVEFDKAELGVKKMKIIQQIKDPIKREKIENEAIYQKLTVQALQEKIEKIEKTQAEKQEKESIIEKINFKLSANESGIKIDCSKEDVEYISEAIQKFEKQIKLTAQSVKIINPGKSISSNLASKKINTPVMDSKTISVVHSLRKYLEEKLKFEYGKFTDGKLDSKKTQERRKVDGRIDAFVEILEELNKIDNY
jgi:hypothetical protein